jgi:hypothetical protein
MRLAPRFLALTIAAAGLAGAPAAAAEFRLIVAGTPGLTLDGDCTVMTSQSTVEHERFRIQSPKTYAISGTALSCTLRKTDPSGRVMISLQQDGRLVAQAETALAYDWVEVRSAGPWGRASGMRGNNQNQQRLTPAPRGK